MMSNHSVKYNFALNLVNTLVGLLFPVITLPYVARVLGPEGIGVFSFLNSIIYYIILISSIGIGIYAVREVARARVETEKRDRVTAEIMLLHLLLCAVAYIIVGIVVLTVDKIRSETTIFLVLSIPIIFNALGVNWFYQAIEDFTYITVRSLAMKLLALAGLFLFVRDKGDLLNYAIVYVVADSGNYVLNFFRLRSYINLKNIRLRSLRIFRHLSPALRIFTLNIITSIYLEMGTMLLGFMADEDSVGFLATATRFQRAILSIVTALGTTLLPRMSHLYNQGAHDEFHKIGRKSLDFIIMVSLPISTGLLLVSPQLIPVACGESFTPAIPTMQIIAPTILLIGVSGIVGMQILYPQGLERIVITCTLAGATVFLLVAIPAIPVYKENGAATAFLTAELTVTLLITVIGRKHLRYKFINADNLKALLSTIVMSSAIISIELLCETSLIAKLGIEVTAGIAIYSVCMIATKHRFVGEITNIIKSKKR